MKKPKHIFARTRLAALSAVILPVCVWSAGASQDIAADGPASGERPSGPIDPEGCVTEVCHPNVKEYRALHGPVAVDACDACHAVVSEEKHEYALSRQGLELCTFCHDVPVTDEAVVHQPLIDGQCEACHDPHGGPSKKFLRAPTASELCGQCHDDVVGDNRWVHGPVAAGACAACHSPHASERPGLLAVEGSELCTGCHVLAKEQLESMQTIHEPVAGDCRQCHDAHASNHKMMLLEDTETLCLNCHDAIKETIETANTQHAAVTTERACLNCHEAHASDYARLMQDDMLVLCFECHDKDIEGEDGVVLGNIKAVIEGGTSLHGPIGQGNCAACHMIHGGDEFRLLVREYPAAFYAPFNEESYALCFSCHEPELVQDETTRALTNFRNGDVNLHYLHVNRKKKGRTCRACHETHASNKANHIRESVPFGRSGWPLPIKFRKLEKGGSCTPGCHKPFEYNRDDPVDYEPPDEPPIWPTETNQK